MARRPRLPSRGGSVRALLARVVAAAAGGAAALGSSGCCAPLIESWGDGSAASRVAPMAPHLAEGRPAPNRALPRDVCMAACGAETCFPATVEGSSGVVSEAIVCNDFVAGYCHDSGFFRMPAGRRDAHMTDTTTLADAARELGAAEAASIEDFSRLARDLARLGAPQTLVRRARRAMKDEIAHARVMRRLAGDGDPAAPAKPSTRAPSGLVALACENVRLGCVGETWGALLLSVQSERAALPRVRSALGRLARDEARHAALAFAIHAWAWPRLSSSQRARVRSAARQELRALVARAAAPVSGEVATELGLPSENERSGLGRALSGALGALI